MYVALTASKDATLHDNRREWRETSLSLLLAETVAVATRCLYCLCAVVPVTEGLAGLLEFLN